MTRQLSVVFSDELAGWIRDEAGELDVATSAFIEAMVRAAFKKIGAGEALRLGVESMAYTPKRSLRPALPWEVVTTIHHRGRVVAEELRLGPYRLGHKGARREGGNRPRTEQREPHGRDDQALDGWYLTGPHLVSPFIWLGTNIAEAKREASVWGAHLPEQRTRRSR